MTEELSLMDQGAVAQEFLEVFLDEFGAEGSVAVTEIETDTLEVAVTGTDLGLLIGPKGATLSALQELTRAAVQRRSGRTGRILVDVGGYRQKRREALERFAQKVVADVMASGVEENLEPMNAADRKVIHDAVNGIDGVTTRSEGEEPRRSVVIAPAP